MRSLVVAIGLLAFAAASPVEAKPRKKASIAKTEKKRTKRAKAEKNPKREKSSKRERLAKSERPAKSSKRGKGSKKRIALAKHDRQFEFKGPLRGQSIGAPWSGRLREATRLPDGEGYHLRRPWRAYGTKSMVETIFHAVGSVRERFPEVHVLAIGDLSAERGGPISEHSSHQSGRDVDLGLYYTEKPRGYPGSFIVADADSLDPEATFALVEKLANTGRVQMMFLDFKLQGVLYDWARENGHDEDELGRLFQFPHGRGQSIGLVRHEPNHADHLHVRFRCPPADSACR